MQNLLTLAALGVATYRVTQLIVHDSILDGWRKRVEAWYMDGIGPDRSNSVRTFFRTLLGCTYCVGFHAAWLTVLTYHLAIGGGITSLGEFLVFGIESFVVAGIGALLNRLDDTLPVR